MNFDFFDKLNADEAKLALVNFLSEETKSFSLSVPDLEKEGIKVDYSIESIKPVLRWVISNIKNIQKKEDVNLPVGIRETEVYKKGLLSFDEFSNILVLSVSFYLGECFIRNYHNYPKV